MDYAVLRRDTGCIIDICPNLAAANDFISIMENGNCNCVAVPIDDNNHLVVQYTELSGPWEYGCSCPELESYGKPIELATYLTKFVQNATHIFGPDKRDIRDYLRHCTVTVDGKSYENWSKIVDDVLNKNTIYL